MSATTEHAGDRPTAAIWAYPWDLLAEGLDQSLERIARAGLTGISLAVSYHAGMLLLPHNPRQKVRFLEDGAIYFRPPPGHFDGLVIQPRVSELAKEMDPLTDICEAAQRHGLEVVAWMVCCHNSHQGARHPDAVTRNAFGDPYPFALCPSQPSVREYLCALVAALSQYPLAALQLESYSFMGFRHGHHHEKVLLDLGPLPTFLMGLCFCPACRGRAEAEGIDFETVRAATRTYLEDTFEGRVASPQALSREVLTDELPALAPYLQMRDRVTIDMVRSLAQASARPISLLGVTREVLDETAPCIAEVTESAYRLAPQEVAEATRQARALVGPSMRLGIGIEANPHLSPTRDNLVAKVRAAWDSGADGLYFYNYGLMPLRSLGWLGDALRG